MIRFQATFVVPRSLFDWKDPYTFEWVRAVKLRARLAVVGLADEVKDIRAFFGDRLKGGSGYELMFAMQVTWSEVRRRIVKL